MVAIKRELHDFHGNFYEELEWLLRQLAAEQRPVNGDTGNLVPVSLKGETVEALAILAAQRRFASRGRYRN